MFRLASLEVVVESSGVLGDKSWIEFPSSFVFVCVCVCVLWGVGGSERVCLCQG